MTLGSLDGKPGLAIVELNSVMSLAYDFEGAGLWMAWQGTAKPEASAPMGQPAGPVPADPADPGETRLLRDGPVFHTRRTGNPWSARKGNQALIVSAALKRTVLDDGLPRIIYALRVGRDSVRVVETPQFDDHYGAKALFRFFVITGLPAGTTLRLDLRGRLPDQGERPAFTETGTEFLDQTGSGQVRVKTSWPEMNWGTGW
jgi:hypothetical protein